MHRKKHNKKAKGFSLIELIVVIAIIGIMTAILFSATLSDRTNRDLEVAARQIASGLRQTQNYALTGKKQDAKRSCTFTFVPNGNTYSIEFTYYEPGVTPDANNNNTPDCGDAESGTMVSATELANGVSVLGPTPVFTVPNGNIFVGSEQIKNSQVFILTKEATLVAVCLSPAGRIDEIGAVESKEQAVTACKNL